MLSPLVVKAALRWVERIQLNQGGVLWLAVLAAILVAADYKKPFSRRNLDILLLLALSVLLVDLIDLGAGGLVTDPSQKALFGTVFLGIFLVNVALLLRALVGAFGRVTQKWTPNLSASALVVVTALFLACNVLLTLARTPDDSGYCVNRGARRMLQTGQFPYGDPGMGWCGAIYGPLLYVAHVPFQLPIAAIQSAESPPGPDASTSDPPALVTKLVLLAFHLLGIVSLRSIGRQLASDRVGLGLVVLYISSTYLQGLGGEGYLITGLTHISHIAPTAVTLAAFAMLGRPFVAGALLGTAAGILFYPAFFFPLWRGYYFWRGKEWRGFAAGFTIVCVTIGLGVWWLMPHAETGALQTFLDSTVGDHEAPSTFSFWGTHPQLAAVWQTPVIDGWYLLKPAALLFAVFVADGFVLARGRNAQQLALLTAAIGIAVQLWKSHAGGTYVERYYPFLLIGLFAGGESPVAGVDADKDS